MSNIPPEVSKGLARKNDGVELCDKGGLGECPYSKGECPRHDDVEDPEAFD